MNDKLKALLADKTGDQFVAARLQIDTTLATTPAEVRETVAKFPFSTGWLCCTDRVEPLYTAADLEKTEGKFILSGELANDSESLHIRQSDSGWTITRFTAGRGDDCLMLREQFIGTENNQDDRMNYEVYWQNGPAGYQPLAARFSGITKGGN